ncbi:hypothetical protein HBI36_040150 [Parastagonospora nodorum]|nr:hypothetical protein HBH73_053640 [Parastagonospora nodorum]KAH5121134.1 hypothetical protein HBH71_053270 [Parastagonospora nodorum]KAH6026937.1 hypothetical protein HBI83_050710 [Parastagonospora nodorum]KAH6365924.1 hypothetical protein HBI36_040150 [Parastagonospora nodorum]KAH6400570.1 hypothetical protein HBI60_073690 [Parastagonospora nodorum]
MRLKANSDNAGSWHNPSRHRTCQSPCGSARRRLIERSLSAPYPKITEAETLRLWHTLLTSGRPAVK